MQRQTSFQSECPLRHLQRCVKQPDVQPHLTRSNKACGAAGRVIHWISTDDSHNHLHIQACRASLSHVGQEESSQGEELGAILQPGSWHTGRAWIERRVLAEDLKIARRDNKARTFLREPILHHADDKPKIREKELNRSTPDSILSTSEHK